MTVWAHPVYQIALPTKPTESSVWYDLTPRLRGLPTFQRGTGGLDAAVSAGHIQATLDNADRAVDPSHAGGPFYGWLKVRRRCRTGVALNAWQQPFTGAIWDKHPPVAAWYLGEPAGTTTAYNQVGGVTGNHGAYTGGVALGQIGLVGTTPDTSASLDGTNDYVAVADVFDLSGNAPFSVLLVFNPSVVDGTFRRLIDKEASGVGGWGVHLQSGAGLTVYRVNGGTAQTAAAPAANFAVGTTAIALVTYDGATLRAYAGGVLKGSGASAQSIPNTTAALNIGRSAAHGGHFGGRLGPVVLWDTCLTSDDAAALYAAAQGSYEPRFDGFLDPMQGSREGFSGALLAVPASDGIAVLANAPVSGSRPEEPADVRIGAVLDSAQWTTGEPAWILGDPVLSVLGLTTIPGPRGDRALDPASAILQATTLDGNALPHLQDAERSEQGLFFIGRDGAATLHSRQRRLLAGLSGPKAVFGDRPDLGELPYVAVVLEDGTQLYNRANVTRINGTEQVWEDAASQAEHLTSALPALSVSVTTDADALAIAQYKVSRHKDQKTRITRLILDPYGGATDELTLALCQVIFGSELGDVYRVLVRPPGGGDPIDQLVFLDSISEPWVYDAQSARFTPEWGLSAADPGPLWILGDPTYSVLGSTTVASWIG